MKTSESDINAAAQAAGRGLLQGALQRNPIVAVATALLGPILNLFARRRTPPSEVRQVRLESYSSCPVTEGNTKAVRAQYEGSTNPFPPPGTPRARTVAVRSYSRALPAARANLNRGGRRHG